MKIRCSTLFNISNTGVNTRREPNGLTKDEMDVWNLQRKKQANYETILQIINLRAQPEDITQPTQDTTTFTDNSKWGYTYKSIEDEVSYWNFEFIVNHGSVFNDGVTELGSLTKDCEGVPMLTGLGEYSELPNKLDITQEQCNIYFEIVDEED